jgi:hypothetical protein
MPKTKKAETQVVDGVKKLVYNHGSVEKVEKVCCCATSLKKMKKGSQ